MMTGFFAEDPYAEYAAYFRVNQVPVVSNQSGADHLERTPPTFRDTALGAEYGCYDIDLACTPFTNTLPIRRLPLHEGDSAELPVVYVDPETLEVRPVTQRYTRTAGHTWRYESVDTGYVTTFEVDEHGLVLDYPDEFRRVS